MKNVAILIAFLFFSLCSCQRDEKNVKVTTIKLKNQINDSVFLGTLNLYINTNNKSSKSNFVQVFVNYEQNLSRYIFFRTKSLYDLTHRPFYDSFYCKDNLVFLYTGLEHIFQTKTQLPGDFKNFINEKDFFSDVGKTGEYKVQDENNTVIMDGNIWELRVYHSFCDSIVINKRYQGKFIWDASRAKLDSVVPFIKPVVHDDEKIK